MTAPIYDSVTHERHHKNVADPGCELCASILRHPAGTAVAEERERAQHDDQAIADKAVVRQDDRTWMQRREWLLTGLGLVFASVAVAVAIVLAVTGTRPFNGFHMLAVLLAVAGGGCLIGGWVCHDRRVRGGDPR